MTMKRKRRAASQVNGLAPGETLNRAQLPGREALYWGWVSSVPNKTSISNDHFLRTCGFSPTTQPRFCRNQYARSSDTSSELLPVTDPDGDLILVSDEGSVCDKKSCQSNPYCLNYLGQKIWEDEGSSKEYYLKLLKLGSDPITRVREPGQPVGLKNLGATCYANAFLQVWFQDLDFRYGVYDCKPTESNDRFEETPVFQLQTTFAALQESSESVFNPVKLVESLKLRTTEQQDAQEFSKLFISHLDEAFQKQSQPDLRTLVADKFQGEQVYGTICGKCNNQSNRTSDYLEIEVNIEKNGATLEDRLTASLKTEILSGDNAYFCSRCECLVDATRFTAYNTFPPVLHFSILRFVYDLSSMERKKSKHTINFPLSLDMNQFLATERRTVDTLMYDLRGVLLHKGASAYHGHYEAQVFDVSNQSWYQFNDEVVTHIGMLGAKVKSTEVIDMTGEGASTKGHTTGRGKKKRRIESDDEEDPSIPRRVSSKDAYMLVYVRRSEKIDATSAVPISRMPPRHVMITVDELNERYHKKSEEYNARKKAYLECFSLIREKVINIYSSWEASPLTKAVVVSKHGLEKWLARHQTRLPQPDDENPGVPEEVSISDILCEHGALDPSKASDMKCINESAYDKILATGCNFTPLLYTDNVCSICVTQTYQEKRYQQEHPLSVSTFNEVCEVGLDEVGFWISKPWLRDWRLARPKMHVPYQEDPAPDCVEYDVHVRCEHGGLCPNIADRRRISKEGAQIIRMLYPSWDPPSTDVGVCPVCKSSVSKWQESNRGLRKRAENEKNRLKRMYEYDFSSQPSPLEGTALCIIPDEFTQDWKQWLLRPTKFPRPNSVNTTPLFCEHDLLLVDPNSPGDMDSLSVITIADWEILRVLYETGPIVAIQRSRAGERHPGFAHEIEVCQDCRIRRVTDYEEAEIAIRIHAPGEPVPTQASTNGAPKPDVAQHRSANGVVTYRKSRRLRNGKFRVQKRRFVIRKSTTVNEIKMMIYEELDIPPVYQTLFLNDRELADGSATVAEIGLLLNDTLDLRQDQETDQTSDMEEAQKPRANEVEGFGGTLLGGFTTGTEGSDADDLVPSLEGLNGEGSEHPPSSSPAHHAGTKACPACTFDNSSQDKNCRICLNRLED